ncbi:hypothetical protein TYRP_012218 [Tyrophagus putrescentiae]|nr:hypothetical protein TYRP_023334 [Tyrophagus putrescentiae]KAH9407401.1 hypothetical protein TYRP_012218 [Tyrophagus putrescentiae]
MRPLDDSSAGNTGQRLSDLKKGTPPRKSSERRGLKRPTTWRRTEVTSAMLVYADSPFRASGLHDRESLIETSTSSEDHGDTANFRILPFPVSSAWMSVRRLCFLLVARFSHCVGALPSVAQKPYLIECSTVGAYADSGGKEAAAD